MRTARWTLLVVTAALAFPGSARAEDGLLGKIDLMKTDGVNQVKGQWRYAVVTTGVGPVKNDIEPKAHGAFDDSKWQVLKPETLTAGRGVGFYSWCWYRIQVTIPDKVAGKPFPGGPVWFQTIVDDYGEIYVDGNIDLSPGKGGRGAISGFITRQRVRLQKPTDDKTTPLRDAKPGDVFQIAILGINGPFGNPPNNKIFLKPPTDLEFFSKDAKNAGADKPDLAPRPTGKQFADIDLLTKDGINLTKAAWRRQLINVHAGKNKNGIEPKAHGTFDDSKWEQLEDPSLLTKPFGPGKFSMAWYRTKLTLPDKVGDKEIAGSAVWFTTTANNYAEIWINGKFDPPHGKAGREGINGFNVSGEMLLTSSAKPGQTFQIAVLAANGPFGNPADSMLSLRTAGLRFYRK